jgi:type I restriction enzyme S subunit
MKKSWKVKKLGELCDVIGGGTPSKRNTRFYNGNIPWATVRDMKGDYIFETEHKITVDAVKQSSTNIIPKGNVVIATRVGLGKVCLIKNDTAINQDLRGIVPKNKSEIEISFLFKWFKSIAHLIVQEGTGATVQGVKLTFIKDLPITFPPLPEQQRIVSILDTCFEAIEKAKSNAERNLQNANELFESYLNGVFEKGGKEWEHKPIREICRLINGKAYKKEELLNNGKYRVLRVGNFFTSDHWYYSDLELEEDKYCENEDLLYAWSASFGPRIWKEEKVIYHYHIWKVIPNEDLISKEFLYTIFEWDKEKIKAEQGTGTTMIHVSKGSMESRTVPIPPIEKQKRIIRELEKLRSETKKLEFHYRKKMDDLDELKKSVLQKAFSGELVTDTIEIPS